MKILCVADNLDPIVYSNGIKDRFKDVDMVLSAGDLPLSYYDFIMSLLNKPVYFVFGNHNLSKRHLYAKVREDVPGMKSETPQALMTGLAGSGYIGGKIVKEKGLLIAGLGGSIRYSGGENQYTDFCMYLKVLKLVPRLWWNRIIHGRYLDILVTHAPPLGINDRPDRCHTGFKALRWFIEVFRPRYLVHGHVHLYDSCYERKVKYLETWVVNAYNHCSIELEIA